MTTELESWPREHYEPGGGEPYLFYVLFGDIDAAAPLSRATYRCNGIPEGLDVMAYGPGQNPEALDTFREGYLWEEFTSEQPAVAKTVAYCQHGILLRGTPNDDSSLDYFRDTVGLIMHLVDHGGHVIYDPFMFRWWLPEDWKQAVFEPARPVPLAHTTILVSPEQDGATNWFHSRGMRKFGRPDISVHCVSESMESGVIELCNRLMVYQANGLVVPEGFEVNLESLQKGAVIRHAGDLQDPEFNNVHLDVTWPNAD